MKSSNTGKAIAVGLGLLLGGTALAEEAEKFSRANCINNESITYNWWDPPVWRLTFSYHQDLENNYAEHYVASGPFSHCDAYGCWYLYENTTDASAIHVGEGGVPGSTRWATIGDHRTYLDWLGVFTYYWTTARDCNIDFSQFN
jgi:hypothetical protein